MNARLAPINSVAQYFGLLAQPARLQILILLDRGEACVCHIEAVLGYRQAYISQQLKSLREAGLLTYQREGKHIFYSLANPRATGIIYETQYLLGLESEALLGKTVAPVAGCICPRCTPEGTISEAVDQEILSEIQEGE